MEIVQNYVESYIPSKEQILEIEKEEMQLEQIPLFPTEHFFSGGMYCRRVWRPKGALIVGKTHKKDHLFTCVSGEILAWTESGIRHLIAGDVVESKAGTKRVTFAITDAICMTTHVTDKINLEEIESELIEPEINSLYDVNNILKTIRIPS